MITEQKPEEKVEAPAEVKTEIPIEAIAEVPKAAKLDDRSSRKPCPNHPKNPETIKLQGDPHTRCAWCHTVLD